MPATASPRLIRGSEGRKMPLVNWPNSAVCRTRRSRGGLAALLILGALAGHAQEATIRTNVDEVVLDLIVRDKKGKPVTDLKPGDITVSDNGSKQKLAGFRLVSGAEAIAAGG